MITLDVCIEPLFTNLPTEERIVRVGKAGFKAIEFWLHDATFNGSAFDCDAPRDPKAIRQACETAGICLNNLVVNPPDDGTIGGSPILEETHAKYLERVENTIAFANAAGCAKAITCAGDTRVGISPQIMRNNIEKALGEAARIAEKKDFVLLLEPLNTRVDHAGYFVNSSAMGAEIVRSINSPNLRLLFDVYHMQIMEGDLTARIGENVDVIGHFHSAAVPGRGEHDKSEVYYPFVLQRIAALGYDGCFGLEYFPAMSNHSDSLTRVHEHLMTSGVCM